MYYLAPYPNEVCQLPDRTKNLWGLEAKWTWGLEFLRNVVALHLCQSLLFSLLRGCTHTCPSLGSDGGEERNPRQSSWLNFLGGERRQKEACWVGWRGSSSQPGITGRRVALLFNDRPVTSNESRKCMQKLSGPWEGNQCPKSLNRHLLPGASLPPAKQSTHTPSWCLPVLPWEATKPLGLCTLPGARSHTPGASSQFGGSLLSFAWGPSVWWQQADSFLLPYLT